MKPSYASPFRRLFAYWIDIMLLYAVLVGLQFGFVALTNGAINNWIAARHNGLLTWGWIFLTVSLPMWLYFILSESGLRQATLGKSLLGIKVTDLAGHRLTQGRATLRTFSKLVFFEIGHLSFLFPTPLFDTPDPPFRIGFVILLILMVVYFVLSVVTARHQSLHDFVASSLVLRSGMDNVQTREP